MSQTPDLRPIERPVAQGGMSMGEGRVDVNGDCSRSPDGKHHDRVVSCVQSVERFVCDHCGRTYVD